MMGFALEEARGPSIAVAPKHIVVNIADLLERPGSDRAKWLRDEAELKLSSADALSKAKNTDEVMDALAKKVSRYTPRVLPVGALYLQPTEERRRSGSHYTPRSLTQPIVATTFRPVLERHGDQATPQQILDLKVCDPAMGSGAFLVESCRLLAERLVKAWAIHGRSEPLPPDEDELTLAKRLVAERCLYGVDKNIFAVDLAKLSLWLATLAREHPFTFLDHALRHGDSLVGLSREQIACFNWEIEKQLPFVRGLIDERVAEAQRLREQIQGLATSDDVPQKTQLLRDAEDALEDVRIIGDLVVSAFFERDKPKDRKTLRTAYAGQVQDWLNADPNVAPSRRERLATTAEALRRHEHPIPPFHWQVEFPEVFTRANGGFDVIVGNPPFLGGKRTSTELGEPYRDWLQVTHDGATANADLAAHFYRRAFSLLCHDGAFGLIATNTIAQGDTRATGLCWMRHHDGTIFAARKRVKWPGEAAAVVVSVVHMHKGPLMGPFDLNGRMVDRITAFLFHSGGDDDPARLGQNKGRSFIGSYVLGMGFTFDDTDTSGVANPVSLMNELIRKNPGNAERIFPYIGGEEVNESPIHAHQRYVINFGQLSEEEARQWPDLIALVEAKVKPERTRRAANGAYVLRDPLPQRWWHYADKRPALYEAIRGLDSVIACTLHQHYWQLTILPCRMVYSHALCVFASQSMASFAVLQSRGHEIWAVAFGSSLKDDLRYTPSDCFETFPFPDGWKSSVALNGIGSDYYEFRAALMVENNEGLTSTYNRFHDPNETDASIVRLRQLHDAMDRAVLDAYRWTDIRPTCEFLLDYEIDVEDWGDKRRPYRYRWPDNVRDEVLGRLLTLNAERAAAEQLAGGAAAPSKASPKRKKAKSVNPSLLDESV